MIPDEAVEAAAWVLYLEDHLWDEPWETAAAAATYRTNARIALEAALPYLLSHEREETRLAHVDAVVNRETKRSELAEAWDAGIKAGIRCDGTHNPYRSQA